MAVPSSQQDTLEQLHSKEQESLLDAIDQLRSHGVSHHDISLPQVIVCGDQSSGKSSVLEGLTRLRFPTKDALCTTFATELILRRTAGPAVRIVCSILPSKNRTQAQKSQLLKFQRSFSSREDFSFPSLLEEAKEVMKTGSPTGSNIFSEDILRIRYTGPDLPSLTIVDLPGLIHYQIERQSAEDAKLVQNLVREYMSNEKSIILAVVSARNDADNQVVLKYIQNEFDPSGTRSLGIITKPDTLDAGSDSEQIFIKLAQNKTVNFELGWHVVKNRSFSTRDQSDEERDQSERQFFDTGAWRSIARSDVGIDTLRTKLSKVLVRQIRKELPSLVTAIGDAIKMTESGLNELGEPRETLDQQRTYLIGKAERFQSLTQDALRGTLNQPFFNGHAAKKLRNEIQNFNLAFAHIMFEKGPAWKIVDDVNPHPTAPSPFRSSKLEEYEAEVTDPEIITRSEFLEIHVGEAVQQNRGPGLTPIINPVVVCEIFRQQASKWEDIAKWHVDRVFQAVVEYVDLSLGSLMDGDTFGKLNLEQIKPELAKKKQAVDEKVGELVKSYAQHDPIMYDPSFMAELDHIRGLRFRASKGDSDPFFRASKKTKLLTESIDDFTSSEILDLVETYYKRAVTVFINNIAVLGIENCLVAGLASIFSPSLVSTMDQDRLQLIGSESEETRTRRTALKEKLAALKSGKRVLDFQVCKSGLALQNQTQLKKPASTPRRPVRIEVSRPQTPSSQTTRIGDDDEGDDDQINQIASSLSGLKVTPPRDSSTARRSSASRSRPGSVSSLRSMDSRSFAYEAPAKSDLASKWLDNATFHWPTSGERNASEVNASKSYTAVEYFGSGTKS